MHGTRLPPSLSNSIVLRLALISLIITAHRSSNARQQKDAKEKVLLAYERPYYNRKEMEAIRILKLAFHGENVHRSKTFTIAEVLYV